MHIKFSFRHAYSTNSLNLLWVQKHNWNLYTLVQHGRQLLPVVELASGVLANSLVKSVMRLWLNLALSALPQPSADKPWNKAYQLQHSSRRKSPYAIKVSIYTYILKHGPYCFVAVHHQLLMQLWNTHPILLCVTKCLIWTSQHKKDSSCQCITCRAKSIFITLSAYCLIL